MISYDELNLKVKSMVKESRYEHILRVVDRAVEYASVYGLDIEKVRLTALAHDMAKNMDYEEYNDLFDDYEMINPSLKHAKVGAYLVRDLGFDSDMINAVSYHTTGRENMSMLEKIIYLADATESARTFGSTVVDLVKRDIDYAMVVISSFTITKLLEAKKIIHIDSIKCYNFYNKLCNKKGVEYA